MKSDSFLPKISASLLRPEWFLVLALLLETGIFSQTAMHFTTARNALEIVRLSTELGLLALALTPVILTGGIDLSVGSLLGLCAVTFGKLWRDAHLPLPLAAALALLVGTAGGGFNAGLITLLRLPPLIVTLGTFSLFRGLAEGLTRGVDNFTGFPEGFLFLGQGYLPGGLPVQLPLLLVIAAAVWLLVHRTVYGRAWRAIGFAPDGARFAGIPVVARLTAVYTLSGFLSAVAALVYVAHLGQAKSDAGNGYELLAITAVVLGGASIFGGIGSVHGTVLGFAVLAVLGNGLRLSDQPSELTGILTGVLLLGVLIAEALLKKLPTWKAGRFKKESLTHLPP